MKQHWSEKAATAEPGRARRGTVPARSEAQPGATRHPILQLQATIGNQAVNRLLQSGKLQTKRTVSRPGDRPVQRQESDEEELFQSPGDALQKQPGPFTAPPAQHPNRTGLPDHLKAGIESLSGFSMDDVRVYYNSSQPAQLNALAYTQGTEIHVAPGQEQHLPHEAWHVVQQAQRRVQPTMQLKDSVPVNDDAGLEREAEMMGARAVQRCILQQDSPRARPEQAAAGLPIQRQVLANITVGDNLNAPITDVIIGGRTPSPFASTMGAHSTAWVAHVDQVRRVLIGRDLVSAATSLCGLATAEINSELLTLQDLVDSNQKAAITTAQATMSTHIQALTQKLQGGDASAILAGIRRLIDSYLTFVNYLPSATVMGGDPSGHGEGSARSRLNTFEYLYSKIHGSAKVTPEITDAITAVGNDDFGRALRREANQAFANASDTLARELSRNLWLLFAAETPGVFAKDQDDNDKLEVWKTMVKNFLSTIRSAYPYAYQYTHMEQSANQRAGLDFALVQVTAPYDTKVVEKLLKAIDGGLDKKDAAPNPKQVGPSDLKGATSYFQSSIFLDADDKVGDIVMIGRTESPFGSTMGRHSTAWVAHQDALRKMLKGKSVGEALRIMMQKSKDLLGDKSLELANIIDEKQQTKLAHTHTLITEYIAAITSDQTAIANKTQDPFSNKELTDRLEHLILLYMTFMNFLPGSTINHGSVPAGRNEGRHRQFLVKYEQDCDNGVDVNRVIGDDLLSNILGLWDGEPLQEYEQPFDISDNQRDVDRNHPLYERMTKEMTNEEQAISLVKLKEYTFERFVATIQEAYPHAAQNSKLAGLSADDALKKQYGLDSKPNNVKRKNDDNGNRMSKMRRGAPGVLG